MAGFLTKDTFIVNLHLLFDVLFSMSFCLPEVSVSNFYLKITKIHVSLNTPFKKGAVRDREAGSQGGHVPPPPPNIF